MPRKSKSESKSKPTSSSAAESKSANKVVPVAETSGIPLERVRRFWHRKQGLAGRGPNRASTNDNSTDADSALAPVVEAVRRTGWVRTLGGIDAYLAIAARCATASIDDVHRAVEGGHLRVVPAVRGCIYLVPAEDVPVTMALAADLSRPRNDRDFAKAGVTRAEIEALAEQVGQVLDEHEQGLQTHEIRAALPDGAVRSLGEAGKKVGMSSPLPAAIRELEFRNAVVRMLPGGRLDSEKYVWRLASHLPVATTGNAAAKASAKSPATKSQSSSKSKAAVKASVSAPAAVDGETQADRLVAIARRFFAWFGPATLKSFAAFTGVALRDAKAAVAQLPIASVAIEGFADDALILQSELDDLHAMPAPTKSATPVVSFLPFEDNLVTVHGGPGVLVQPKFHHVPIESWSSRAKPTTLGVATHMHRRALIVDAELAGFWEYDALAPSSLVTHLFTGTPTKALAAAIAASASPVAACLTALGHARSFSLDTAAAVAARAAALRALS